MTHASSIELVKTKMVSKLNCETLGRQVKTFWHWVDYVTQQCVDSGKTPCYINLDETSVPRCAAKAVGYIAPPPFWPGRLAPRRPLQKQQKRAAITHIALIASMPEVQPKLPQILFATSGLSLRGRSLAQN